jgi:AraC-like DNA-binding protein/mannose-6-phosphate isomerase-like protein (cupin superfamily)
MNQFLLQQGKSAELLSFPYILELAVKKNQTIHLHSLPVNRQPGIRIYYIIEGKFEWIINDKQYSLYPGDTVFILPEQSFGSEKEVLDIGAIAWIDVQADQFKHPGKAIPGSWSSLSPIERRTIGKVLTLNDNPVVSRLKETGIIFQHLADEIFKQEIGFVTRCGQLIDELFILIARQLTRRHNSYRDFPQTFTRLEQTLRENLAHQWTVAEMAALVGLGTTAFTEKVKNYTGFSPLNYLINIRISEAIKLLKRTDINLTDIALDTGFYSSQHFSTTFKKLTGYTPSQFKKNITQNK